MQNKKLVPIKYTARDFNSIKSELVEYAKKYYPDTFKDFNQASFGSLMLDTVSYIGDVLSFYLDYSANESHLKTSVEYNNVLKHGYKLGYKHNPFASSSGVLTIYCLVPSNESSLGPDMSYAPVIKKGSTFNSEAGVFTLTENVNMASENFSIRVAKTDPDTGNPTFYAIKGYGTVISGIVKTESISVGSFKRFLRVELANTNISEVISIFDTEGNEYYEVDYLSQNIVYKEIPNKSSDSTTVANILIPVAAPRRFIVETENEGTFITFGASDSVTIKNDQMLEDPNDFVIEKYGKNTVLDNSFDPNRLVNSDKFGVGPSNTTLEIEYRVNTVNNVNAGAGAVSEVGNLILEFFNPSSLNPGKVQTVGESVVVENEDAIVGSITTPTSDELKIRILNNFAAQNRAVTERDYEVSCYSMPAKFGAIKRAKVVKDQTSFKKNLNLYVISEDSQGYLSTASITLKNNLKTWLEKNKMISDTIDIIDGKVVNFGVDFTVLGVSGASKADVLSECISALKKYFVRIPELGEPLMVNDIISTLKKIDIVLDVKEVKIMTKTGTGYSSSPLNINVSTNSSFYDPVIGVPLNVIWEIKYPDSDIHGTIL